MYLINKMQSTSTPKTKGIWIWGETGVGKSLGVRKFIEGLGLKFFLKP